MEARRALLLALLTLFLTACGGSGDAGKVAIIARSETHAKGGTCDKVRNDAINGQLVALYSCSMTDVPPEFRLAGWFDMTTQHFCFAYANGAGLDVTTRFGAKCKGSVSRAVVHVYFCTSDTCNHEATKAQITRATRTASTSPLVVKVDFVSKEHALNLMKQKHPEEVEALPSNPFPDFLTVTPKRSEDVAKVAALFEADPALGIDKVDYRQ